MPCVIITAGAHIEINDLKTRPVAVHKDFTDINVGYLAEML